MNPIQIYNNIGCEFTVDNINLIIGPPLSGYNTLSDNHVGSYIPYLARNIVSNKVISWEIGIGLVSKIDNKIVISDRKIIQSYGSISDNGQKHFYLFANADNYNSGFNNVVVVHDSFTAAKSKACYLIDGHASTIHALLPNANDCSNIELQFKIIGDKTTKVDIKDNNNFRFILRNIGSYVSLACDGEKWIVLNESSKTENKNFTNLSTESFTTLSDPVGDDGAFQYKDGSNFAAGDVFWGSDNKVLFGPDSTEANAKTIIPTSGNYDTIINKTQNKSDFIIYGSGVPSGYLPKNLIFTYDGKLGLNLPSGTKPQTALHIINNSCRESIRIENLSSCPSHVPNITLYHKPSGIQNNSTISKVVFSSRDSNKNKIDYSSIQTVAKNTTAGSVQGQLNIIVVSGSSDINTLSADAETVRVGYPTGYQLLARSASGIRVQNSAGSGFIALNNNATSIFGNSIGLSASTINVSGITNINQSLIVNGINISCPYIPQNKILCINSSGYLAPATTFEISGIGPNKLLTTNSSGAVTGAFADDSFLLTDGDIIWSKYPSRLANICLRQVVPIDEFTTDEFSVGDQIAIITGIAPTQGTLYRNILELDANNSIITGMLLDQNVTFVDSTVSIYSITKGGVLTTQVKTEDGVESDATAIVFSTRPQVDTIFNSRQKDINFKVFGIEDNPALSVIAKAITDPLNSGIYYGYATKLQDSNRNNIEPFPTLISSIGEGVGTTNNSVNFGNIISASWPNRVTSVGTNGRSSFYGTYDQNGNVYEWVEDNNRISSLVIQNVCGGSWRTSSVEGLRSIIPTPYGLELDDVGFRICSRYGYTNESINTSLSLSFAPVSDLDNISDDSVIYTESYLNRSGLGLPPSPTAILNLGKVDQPYQISIYEVTNSQYAAFLNAVNSTSIFGLYNSNMSSSIVGGINRSGSEGSYTYSVKTNMNNKPVVFVDYLSSIRFINWLHNGTPSGTGVNGNHTEDGAYTINTSLSSATITKNKDQRYWLPSLNEWHKAAYFQPIYSSVESDASAVLIRRNSPFEISSGNLAALSVDGATYSDEIVIGTNDITTGALLSASGITVTGITPRNSGVIGINTGFNDYTINIGVPSGIAIESQSPEWDGEFSSYISSSSGIGIQLATSGTIKLVSPSCVKISGLCLDDLYIKNVTYIDPETGLPIEGGAYPGPNGGFIFKDLDTDNPRASSALRLISLETSSGVALSSALPRQGIYSNSSGILSGYSFFRLGETTDGISGESVVISTEGTGEEQQTVALVVDSIRIGPALQSFSGSILTHNGTDTAIWQPADFLRADGITWTRHPKRALEIRSGNVLRFSNESQLDGGTGPATKEEILSEFNIDDTIAIYNQEREVAYVKIAAIVPAGNPDEEPSFFNNETLFEIVVCPALSEDFIQGSLVPDSDPPLFIGYGFSVYKGGFLTMSVEPDATDRFSCEENINPSDSPYGFKPSTINTISIRPEVDTVFNKLAEDIDFNIYGYKKTINNRYEPSIFNTNNRGIPSGLVPALHIDSFNDSSFIGSISSGVFADNKIVIASGIVPDESAKITINTASPYVVATISGVKTGFIYPDAVRPNGQNITSTNDISTYADLTINGYTFSSGIITTELVLKNSPSYSFIPNAPLTINALGQVVSVIPPPQPKISSPPINVNGFAANSSVRLQWSAPEDTGNTNITNYLIAYSENGEIWTNFASTSITDTQYVVTGLENGISYRFKVAAVNSVGVSRYSEPSDAITPTSNAPTQPRNLSIINRNDSAIVIDWITPAYQGPTNVSITNYIVEYAEESSPPGELIWITWPETIGTTTNVTISNLLPGPTYAIRVRAQNTITTGAYSSIRSVGTDGEPEQPEPEPEPSNDWDFGEIAFTGVCL